MGEEFSSLEEGEKEAREDELGEEWERRLEAALALAADVGGGRSGREGRELVGWVRSQWS